MHLGLLKTLVPQPSKSISDPVEERCLTFRKFTIEIPDTLRAPSAEERNNPDWRSYMPSTFFFVAGVKFELVGFISNSDRIEIGPTLDDFRFQSVRIGFRFRLIEKNGRFSGHTGLNLVEISDRYCSVDMFHSGSCALLEDGSKWTRIDEEGKRSFSLELKIYLHSASPVVKGGPVVENVNRRLLHTLPYDVDGEDWSVAAALF